MGAVFYAIDNQLKRPVALKIIRPDVLKKRGILARFKREIKLMAQLNHPSIVDIYDVGTSQGTMYFAMEYLEGKTIHSLIKEGPVRPRRAVLIIRRLAEALKNVHETKILHRDIKPANIILAKGDIPKLMDFGLAIQESATATALTKTGSIVGTLSYTAPEIFRGRAATECTDIYQLGCVLYKMLTQALPLRKDMLGAVVHHPERVSIDKPSTLVSGIDDALDELTIKACHLDAQKRVQSAGELVSLCDKWLGRKKETVKNRPVRPRSVSSMTLPVMKPKASVRTPFILTSLLAILLTVAAVISSHWEEQKSTTERATPYRSMTITALRKQLLLKPKNDLNSLEQLGHELSLSGIAERLGIPKSTPKHAVGLYYMVIFCRKKGRQLAALNWYKILVKEFELTIVEDDALLFLEEIEECARSSDNWYLYFKILDTILRKDAESDNVRAVVTEKAARSLLLSKNLKYSSNELDKAVLRLQPYIKKNKNKHLLYLRLLAVRGGEKSKAKFDESLAPIMLKISGVGDIDVPWLRETILLMAYGWDATKKELAQIHIWLDRLAEKAQSDNERARIYTTKSMLAIRLPTNVFFHLAEDKVRQGIELAQKAVSLQNKAEVKAMANVAHAWAVLHLGKTKEAEEIIKKVKIDELEDSEKWFYLRVRGGILIAKGKARKALTDHEKALRIAPPEMRTYMRVVLGSTNVKAALKTRGANIISDDF